VYQSEQAKLHYAFVYGEDDRVLYRYDVTASPPDRFGEAVGRLAYSCQRRLKTPQFWRSIFPRGT
jgi:hypothetical protein